MSPAAPTLLRAGALAALLCALAPAQAEIKFLGGGAAGPGAPRAPAAADAPAADDATEAALRAGLEYYRNPGAPMAPALARQRWKQAAEAGDARGMVAYGWLLANGIGGLRDVEQAREWIGEARVAGLARATFVSSLLEGRIPGAKKRVESLQMLEQAARDGDMLAANNLGVALELEGNLTGARGLYETAAMAGNTTAQGNLERLRRLARPTDGLNLSRLRLQADDGDTDAMLQLAQRYHRGEGVTQDFAQAIQFYRRAADGGSARAREFISLIFSRPPKDSAQVYDAAWMRELAARINLQSDRRPGGSGVAQNDRPRRNEDPLEGLPALRQSNRAARWGAETGAAAGDRAAEPPAAVSLAPAAPAPADAATPPPADPSAGQSGAADGAEQS
ncbi:MAG: tetratricopeptide repeat protein [Ottowia sp.]|uniref:tetratricopeptide repeat protein n=1 Tax=Ottowia sp. TaxID=1898956 RepID=UPI0039E71A04